jgi:hypothetical protein
MFVVDPPGDSNNVPDVQLTPEQLWRENYGAWLRAMGLTAASRRLVGGPVVQEEPRNVEFSLREVGGRTYAFRMHSGLPNPVWDWPRISLGIDLEVLELISRVLHFPAGEVPQFDVNLPESVIEQSDDVSIFPDGSLLGHMRTWLEEVVEIPL